MAAKRIGNCLSAPATNRMAFASRCEIQGRASRRHRLSACSKLSTARNRAVWDLGCRSAGRLLKRITDDYGRALICHVALSSASLRLLIRRPHREWSLASTSASSSLPNFRLRRSIPTGLRMAPALMECADRRIVIRGSRLRCTCWSPSSGSYLIGASKGSSGESNRDAARAIWSSCIEPGWVSMVFFERPFKAAGGLASRLRGGIVNVLRCINRRAL